MKQRNIIYITGASLAALALSFSPARANDRAPSPGSQQASSANSAGTSESKPAADAWSAQSADAASAGSTAAVPSADAGSPSSASASTNAEAPSAATVRVASADDAKHTADKLSGQKLRGQDGKEVGTIKDFLVDSRSGQIRYAVVSSGGFFGLGDRLRLVPYEMLQTGGDGEGFTTAVTKQQLESAPTVDNQDLAEARVTLDAQQQQQAQQALSGNGGEAGTSMTSASSTGFASTETQGSQGNEFLRASKIKDSEVQANGSRIGSIENIVIEQGGGEAMALVDPEASIGADDQKFLVPLSQIQLGQGDKQVTTSLTQNDFEAAAQAVASQSVGSGTSAAGSLAADSSTSTTTRESTEGANADTNESVASTSDQPSETGLAPQGTASSTDGAVASTDVSSANATVPSPTGSQSGFAATEAQTEVDTDTAAATPNSAVADASNSDRSVWSGKDSEATSKDQEQDVATADTGAERTQPAIAGVYGDMNSLHNDENDPEAKPAPNGRPAESTQAGEPVQGGAEASTPAGYASTSEVSSPPEGRVNNDDTQLTPTGATSADQSPDAKPELISAAQQIRQALDRNEELSGENVQVKPEGEKIVLRGSVTSDSLKEQVENLAKDSASQVEVDNQLEVKQR